jgi:hypothetical protein
MITESKRSSIEIGFYIIVVVVFTVFLLNIVYGQPFGGSVTLGKSERGLPISPGQVAAQAGNITSINIEGVSITRSWQGYFGNVTGVITLDDANNNTLYNWTAASPSGEVYASNSSVTWSSIQCFNFTASGFLNNTEEDILQAGSTSLHGKNMTLLEQEFGIKWDDVDGVNETFSENRSHEIFHIGSLEFDQNECPTTYIYGSNGQGVPNQFEEILMWSPETNATVFVGLLESDLVGFNNAEHDFEMIVLENGHGTDTSVTNYNFYVELE